MHRLEFGIKTEMNRRKRGLLSLRMTAKQDPPDRTKTRSEAASQPLTGGIPQFFEGLPREPSRLKNDSDQQRCGALGDKYFRPELWGAGRSEGVFVGLTRGFRGSGSGEGHFALYA